MKNTQKLAGRAALVTGSSHGIGKAIALSLAAQGAAVVINARGASAIDAVVDEIKAAGGTSIGFTGAVNDPDAAEAMVAACVDSFGGIDILVNNAGVLGMGTVDSCEHDHWHQVMDVNINGTFYCSQYASRAMKRQRYGRIVNCASDAALGVLGGSCYAASKAAVIGLTRAMARDLGMFGITVNAYSPYARTRMSDQADPAYFEQMCDAMIARGFWDRAYADEISRMGLPNAVAPFITYLCLEGAAYINGQTFSVEGSRISLQYEPERKASLHRDYAGAGPWPLQDLAQAMPNTLGQQLENGWPAKSEDEIRTLLGDIDSQFL